MEGPSVRDVQEFEALPEETRELARRVLGPQSPSVDALTAYELGWDEAVEEFSTMTPQMPNRERINERIQLHVKREQDRARRRTDRT